MTSSKRITDVDIINSLRGDESFFVNQNNAIKQINKKNMVMSLMNSTSIELTAENWVGNRQTVLISGVTSNNTVIVSADPVTNSDKIYSVCNVRCVAQAENQLTFSCDTTPTKAITVNVIIFY